MVKIFVGLRKQLASLKIETDPSVCARELFANASYQDDDCSDANLKEVIVYLRGCKGLRIPPDWRPLLPEHL